jgi:nitrogenase molybdenum-iron protein alpha/beta subunit
MAKQEQWGDVCQRVMTCALTGAAAFCAGIPGAQIIANGPLWCYFYALRHLEKADPGIAERFNGTQPDNNAVVYGTEACLQEELARRKKLPPASMLLVENSCAVSLIGDDVAGIAREAGLPYPVVCLDSGGLKGGFAEGYRLTGKRCLECLGLEPRTEVEPGTVNLLGLSPAYYNGANDVQEVKRLLQLCGYRVIACPGAGSTVAEIRQLTRAEFNIVFHEELGLELAQFLQSAYGMPYKTMGLPFGCAGTINWLEAVCGREAVTDVVRAEAAAVTTKISKAVNELRLTWGEPWFDDIVVSAPATLALSLATALRREWFDTEFLTVIVQGKAGSRELGRVLDR